jgi:hypothetical protein
MAQFRAEAEDLESLPPAQKANYEVFQIRCSKCHGYQKALNVKLGKEGWTRYVAKMQRRSGSGINASNGAQIVEVLTYLESPRPEQPPPKDAAGVPDAGE